MIHTIFLTAVPDTKSNIALSRPHNTAYQRCSFYHPLTPQIHYKKSPSSRYEMSQDLLDKQTEILERRYGGLRARRAAVTIQRAFRRRQLLKKFSAITAMAKAADSNARRLQDGPEHGQLVNGMYIFIVCQDLLTILNELCKSIV